MTKNDLAVELCKNLHLDITKPVTLHIVDTFVDILSDAFVKGEDVFLRGFGTLEVRTAKAKKARNIAAGTAVMIPAHRTVKFKVSKQLINRMNNGTVD